MRVWAFASRRRARLTEASAFGKPVAVACPRGVRSLPLTRAVQDAAASTDAAAAAADPAADTDGCRHGDSLYVRQVKQAWGHRASRLVRARSALSCADHVEYMQLAHKRQRLAKVGTSGPDAVSSAPALTPAEEARWGELQGQVTDEQVCWASANLCMRAGCALPLWRTVVHRAARFRRRVDPVHRTAHSPCHRAAAPTATLPGRRASGGHAAPPRVRVCACPLHGAGACAVLLSAP